ncbi:MAG: divalent metal cation transporter [Rhodomicrobium sp.]
MALSNFIALAIMTTTAATLHQEGLTHISPASEAANALAPIAGHFAFAICTLGIIGTGLLAVPVLAGSAGCALAEAFQWQCGLSYKPAEAPGFYLTIAAVTLGGAILSLLPINPIAALYWSAVVNGIIVAPIMAAMMFASAKTHIMGEFAIRGRLLAIGWLATGVMAAAAAIIGFFWIF